MNIQWGWGMENFTNNHVGKTKTAPPTGAWSPLARKVGDSSRAPGGSHTRETRKGIYA